MLTFHAPGACAQLSRIETRGFIHEDLGFRELARGAGDTHPVLIRDLAAAQAVQWYPANGRQHAGHDLLGGISMVKIATDAFVLGFTAAYSAMFTASVDFPIEGRPATITRSPGRRPPVSLSNSVNPVGRPRSWSGLLCHSSIWSITAGNSERTDTAPSRLRNVPSAISKTFCSAASTSARA